MKNYAAFDFHLHSWWSYDACTPVGYYFERAKELGLRAFAITDHNNFDALQEIRQTAVKYPETGYIAASELTARTPYGQLDLVCLNLPLEPTPALVELQKEYRAYNQNMGDAISLLVEKMGHSYTREERRELLLQYRPAFTLDVQGITHVRNEIQADYMVRKSVVKNRAEFYSYLWGEKAVAGLLPMTPDAEKVVRIVHEAGGLVFLAHPYLYTFKEEKRLDALLEVLPLDGLECAHSAIPEEYTHLYRNYCLKHHLLSTAGTDVHCDPAHAHLHLSDGCEMAVHRGEVRWLEEILERVELHYA